MKRRQQRPHSRATTVDASIALLCCCFCLSLLPDPVLGQAQRDGCPCDTPSSSPPPPAAELYPPPTPEVYPSPPPPPPKHYPPKPYYPTIPPPPPAVPLPNAGAGCCVVVPQGPLYVLDPSFNANGAAPAGWVGSSAAVGLLSVLAYYFWLLLQVEY